MKNIFSFLIASTVALQLMAAGTASDAYLNVAHNATIDQAGATVDGMETIYKYTPQGTNYWLTVSNYGVMMTDETQNWFTNEITDSDTGSQYTTAWTATDIFQGPSAYFGSNPAYSAKFKQPTKAQTFYVTFCTQIKQYAYHRSNASYYQFKMEIYECTANADGSITEGTNPIETLSNQTIGAEVLTSSELDPEKIYKVVLKNSYSYLYEIAFKTPGLFDGEITTPEAYDVTNLALEHATMSWSACPGAKSYTLRTYPVVFEGLIFRETFKNCSEGDTYNDYEEFNGPDNIGWSGYNLQGANGGVVINPSGNITTPSGLFAYPYLKSYTVKFKVKASGNEAGQLNIQGGGKNLTFDVTNEEEEHILLIEKGWNYQASSSVWFGFFNVGDQPVELTQYKVYFGDYTNPQRSHNPKYVVPAWDGDTTYVKNIQDTTFSFGTGLTDISHFNFTNAYWYYDVKSVYYDGQESEWSNQILYSLVDVPQFLEDDDDPQGVPGDVDGDGEVTASDITALYSFLLSGDDGDLVYGDQDGDGEVTSGDITFVYSILLGVE